MGLEDDIIPVIADIDGAIAELGGKIKAHAAETFNQLPDVPQSAGYLVAWNQFVYDFETWRLGWWLDRFKRRNEVIAFRKRFNTLQEYFRGLAGTTTAALTTPKFKAAEITGPTFGVPSWALPVALGFGGLVLLSQLGALAPVLASLKGLRAAHANPRRRRRSRSRRNPWTKDGRLTWKPGQPSPWHDPLAKKLGELPYGGHPRPAAWSTWTQAQRHRWADAAIRAQKRKQQKRLRGLGR